MDPVDVVIPVDQAIDAFDALRRELSIPEYSPITALGTVLIALVLVPQDGRSADDVKKRTSH